ncbi:transmembrane protein, putative [Medicago truncatula]|uniref:Transmembrane protein, putative n=1 Tax=Medicago truncatula TaxID=3880 RepID=A0A072U0G2_MEDTR|nr:transmembrane protein, putative [Medicago truncatula]
MDCSVIPSLVILSKITGFLMGDIIFLMDLSHLKDSVLTDWEEWHGELNTYSAKEMGARQSKHPLRPVITATTMDVDNGE